MKITDLVSRHVAAAATGIAASLSVLYDTLEKLEFIESDEIVDKLLDLVAQDETKAPVIEFALANVSLERFHLDATPEQVIGYSLNHFNNTLKRKGLKLKPKRNFEPSDLKLACMLLAEMPVQVDVNLATILGTGEYHYMGGTCFCSDDEIHFPIGIKPYRETWWFMYDADTEYLKRVSISDMEEARTLLTNTLSVEDSTNLEGLAVWQSILGDATPPDDLGRLLATLKAASIPFKPDQSFILDTMPLWTKYTGTAEETPPRFKVVGHVKVRQSTLDKLAVQVPQVDVDGYVFPFHNGTNERKKVDLRRAMVDRVLVQGIQDSLALNPLGQALGARYPLWLFMADKREVMQSKQRAALSVSVAQDIGDEINNLNNVIRHQFRIAHDKAVGTKQQSAAMARAVQASRALLALRKEAGYFDLNTANKSGIFQNTDSTVLSDDGQEFEKLIAQLAAQGGDNE